MIIALVGWGIESQSVYSYFGNSHQYLIASEEFREDFPVGKNISVFCSKAIRSHRPTGSIDDLNYLSNIITADIIFLTPSSKKNFELFYSNKPEIWAKTTSVIQYFLQQSPTNNLIGVTGTKGKGTTTTLIYQMLKTEGKDAYIAGNVGSSPLDILKQLSASSWVVLELSSFQLYRLPVSPHIAVHLMMAPEHLDWHQSFDDYSQAKSNIYLHQSMDDFLIYHPTKSSQSIGSNLPQTLIPIGDQNFVYISGKNLYYKKKLLMTIKDFKLIGVHNHENILAACTVASLLNISAGAVKQTLLTCAGLPHRLELIRILRNVKFVDDSFGTTPETAIVAMDAFEERKIIIIGGFDRGLDFHNLVARLSKPDIDHIILIGSVGPKIKLLLDTQGLNPTKIIAKSNYLDWTMTEIVELAHQLATSGTVVLLSCAASSFDMFKNAYDRGDQFRRAVLNLTD